jgi:NAD(P)-dependent dehydrogenase (short-subunit alcohol dehydrogenase family)
MSQKTIIVTGASSGIGRATSVTLFASAKFRVVLSGRRIGELEETKRLCLDALKEGKEGDVLVVGGDVSKEESVKELFRKAAETFGLSLPPLNV